MQLQAKVFAQSLQRIDADIGSTAVQKSLDCAPIYLDILGDAVKRHVGRIEGGLDEDTLHLLGINLFNKGLLEDFEL